MTEIQQMTRGRPAYREVEADLEIVRRETVAEGVVTLALGSLMIFSDAAYQAMLPTLVAPEDLIDGNSKFELSRSRITRL